MIGSLEVMMTARWAATIGGVAYSRRRDRGLDWDQVRIVREGEHVV